MTIATADGYQLVTARVVLEVARVVDASQPHLLALRAARGDTGDPVPLPGETLPDAWARDSARGPGGRPPTRDPYPWRTIAMGVLLLAMTGQPLSVSRLLNLFWSGIPDSLLGIVGLAHVAGTGRLRALDDGGPLWKAGYEHLRRSLDRLVAPMDPSPHVKLRGQRVPNKELAARVAALTPAERAELERNRGRLLDVCNALLHATLPPRPDGYDGSVATDEHHVLAAARTGGTGTRPEKLHGPDPDAGWFDNERYGPGWCHGATFAMPMHQPYGRELPLVATGMSFGKPTGGSTPAALEALDYSIGAGWGPRKGHRPRLVVDLGYSDKDGLHDGCLGRDYRPMHTFKTTVIPRVLLPEGPILYQGEAFCPAATKLTDKPLKLPDEDQDKVSDDDLVAHDKRVARLRAHQMVTNGRPIRLRNPGADPDKGGRPATGTQQAPEWKVPVVCPAAAGNLRCPLVTTSTGLPASVPAAADPPSPETAPACCTTSYSSFRLGRRDLKRLAGGLVGTWEHADYYGGTRSRNEGYHGILAARTGVGLRPDAYQLAGTARLALITAAGAAATNLSNIASFTRAVRDNADQAPHEDAVPRRADRHRRISNYNKNQRRNSRT